MCVRIGRAVNGFRFLFSYDLSADGSSGNSYYSFSAVLRGSFRNVPERARNGKTFFFALSEDTDALGFFLGATDVVVRHTMMAEYYRGRFPLRAGPEREYYISVVFPPSFAAP